MSNGLAAQAVSVMAGVIAAIVAAVLVMDNWRAPKAVLALTMTASAGLIVGTRLGGWVHDGATMLDDKLDALIGTWVGPGFVVSVVIGVIDMILLVVWIRQGRYDTRTLGAAAAAPVTVTLIPGFLGTALATGIGLVTGGIAWIIGFLLHLAG